MPDITIGVKVDGAGQAAGALQQVGAAADTAGSKAQTAGGRFAGLGTRISGALGGVGILVGGLFALQDTFDRVAQSDLAASRARAKSKDATDNRIKAEKKLQDAITGVGQVERSSNGEISVKKQSTEDITKLTDDYNDALAKEANAQENEKQKTKEAAQAKQRLAFNIAGNVATMAGGLGTLVAFARGTGGVATSAEQAAVGVAKSGSALSGNLGTLLKVAAPLAGAGVAYLVLKNNVGGARDALNSFGEKLGNAVPALKPVLNIVKGIGEAIGIQAGPGLERITQSFAQIQAAAAPFAAALKQHFAEAAGSFQTFISQLGRGDISGAFHTLVASASAVGSQIMNAIRSVNWAQVWQGLQDAFSSSVNWIKSTAGNIGSAIGNIIKTWNWGDAWKSLQDAFWSSVKFLNNIALKVDAAITWALTYIWPPLAEAWNDLKGFWAHPIETIDALIQWALKYIWPPFKAAVLPTLREFWGDLKFGYNALITYAVTHKWPTKEEAQKGAPNFDFNIAAKATLDFTASKIVWPAVDIQVSQYIDTIAFAIKNAPGAVAKIADAVKSLFLGLFIKPEAMTADVSKTSLSITGGAQLATSFLDNLKKVMPLSFKAAEALKVEIGRIDWTSVARSIDAATHDITAYFWNSIAAGFTKAFPMAGTILQGLNIKIPKIPFQAELDLTQAEQKIKFFQDKLKTAQGWEATVHILGNIEDWKNKEAEAKKGIAEIPPQIRTTASFDASQAMGSASAYKNIVTTAAPPTIQTVAVAQTSVASSQWQSYGGDIQQKVPPEIKTVAKLDTLPATVAATTYQNNLKAGLPEKILQQIILDRSQAEASASGWTAHLRTNVPNIIPEQIHLDTSGAERDANGWNHNLGVAIPATATTTAKVNTSEAQPVLTAYTGSSGLGSIPDDQTTKMIAYTAEASTLILKYLGSLAAVPADKPTQMKADVMSANLALQGYIKLLDFVPMFAPTIALFDEVRAEGDIAAYERVLNGIPRNITTTVTTRYVAQGTPPRAAAEGFGPAMVTKPTVMLVGEAGPEMVSVVPMAKGTSKSNREMLIHHDIIPMARGTHGGFVSSGGNSDSLDAGGLIAAVERLVSAMRSRGGLEANLIVDGQRMASTTQKYIGSKSYGDR